MTTNGENTWGVILSSAYSSGPSGDICYFFCNKVKRKKKIKDKPTHAANENSWAVVLKQLYYTVDISNAVVKGNTITVLNGYHALMDAWLKQTASIYFMAKDVAGTYLTFRIGTTSYNYLKCRLVQEIDDDLTHERKSMAFHLEECTV